MMFADTTVLHACAANHARGVCVRVLRVCGEKSVVQPRGTVERATRSYITKIAPAKDTDVILPRLLQVREEIHPNFLRCEQKKETSLHSANEEIIVCIYMYV